jgi:hypothetical protein
MLAPHPPALARMFRAVRLLSRARAADTKQIPAGLEKEVAAVVELAKTAAEAAKPAKSKQAEMAEQARRVWTNSASHTIAPSNCCARSALVEHGLALPPIRSHRLIVARASPSQAERDAAGKAQLDALFARQQEKNREAVEATVRPACPAERAD